MSKKHFSWLLLLTLMAAGLVLLVPGKTGKESIIEETRILPELAAQVNDIEWGGRGLDRRGGRRLPGGLGSHKAIAVRAVTG
jgi:hypothetical protein